MTAETKYVCFTGDHGLPGMAFQNVFWLLLSDEIEVLTLPAGAGDALKRLEGIRGRVQCLLVNLAVPASASLVRDVIVRALGGFRLVLLSPYARTMGQQAMPSVLSHEACLGAPGNRLIGAPWLISEAIRCILAADTEHDRDGRRKRYRDYSAAVAAEPLTVACHDLKHLVMNANPAAPGITPRELSAAWQTWWETFFHDVERSLWAGSHRVGLRTQHMERLFMRIDNEMIHLPRKETAWELLADLLEQLVQLQEDLMS